MQKTDKAIPDFLNALPTDRQEDMKQLDSLISKALPNLKKTLWEGVFWGGSEQQIIGYGEYTYTGSNKKVGSWFLIGLALQKNYISIFISAVDIKGYIPEQYKDVLGKVKVGKSSISFTKLEDVNVDKLEEVIKHGWDAMRKSPNLL